MSSNHDDLSNRLRSGINRGVEPDLSPDVVSGASGRPAQHLTNPARAVRVAGAAALTIAMVTVAALVLTPSLTRAPLFTAAAAPSGPAAAAQFGAQPRSQPGSREAMSSDLKTGLWVDYHYMAAASLPNVGGTGLVYRLVLDGTAPESRAKVLAEALGVSGAPKKADYADPAYPTWVVGPQDGTGASITYSDYGTGDWWYNDPATAPGPATSTTPAPAAAGAGAGAGAGANLAPTGTDARSRAQALFASTGYRVDAADIEITTDPWGTTATAYLTLDGTRTALGWVANWSTTGALAYAAGHSVRAEVRGTFDTISPAAAVTRLSDGRWYGAPGPDYQGGVMMYATDAAGGGLAEGYVSGSGGGSATGIPVDPTNPPQSPIQTDPTPQVVEVTVDNAEATLLLMWDTDGDAWLVPGYAMKMPEGWWNAVASLADGVIALPAPIKIAPATTEDGGTK